MKATLVKALFVSVLLTPSAPHFSGIALAENNEVAEDFGGVVGTLTGGAVGGGAGAAAGGVLGKYGARTLNNFVESGIDDHFDRQNQNFANKNDVTIKTEGKIFTPQKKD